MEETITIKVYDVNTNTYYDKEVPYVAAEEPEQTFEEKQVIINDEQDVINLDFDLRITQLELGI